MIIPNTKRHLNNTKINQIPYFRVDYQGFSWLVIFETGRDGTVVRCLAGNKLKTGRGGTIK